MGNISPELKERAERCCCKMCGKPIAPKLIIYDRYGGHGVELFCSECQKIEYGTEPSIYQLAKEFIDEFEFNYFPDMEENDRCEKLNAAKLCEIFSWLFERLGYLQEDGLAGEIKERVSLGKYRNCLD